MSASVPRSAVSVFVMTFGLALASAVGATAPGDRCRETWAISVCGSRSQDTPEPSPTIHVHVSYAGNVWDTAEGTPLPGAVVGVTTCYGYTYESEADSSGHYRINGTVGEYACESVPWEARAAGFRAEQRTVNYPGQFHYEDFILQHFVPVITLYLPQIAFDRAPAGP